MNNLIKPRLLGAAVKSALTLTFTVFACAVGHAQLTNVAYDGFNYSSGSLSGQNGGGTGWTSGWFSPESSAYQGSPTSMTYPGLSTSGGSAVTDGGSGEDIRTLPLMNSGVVYVQFLSQFGSSGGASNIRLLNDGALTGAFGGNGGSFGSVMSILDASLNPAVNGSSSSSVGLTTLSLTIARIDYQSDSTSLWVNPDLSTFNYENPTAADATYAGLAPVFDMISLYSQNPGSLDEISVMAEPVPEPTTVTLMIAGLGAFLIKGWHRRQTKSRA